MIAINLVGHQVHSLFGELSGVAGGLVVLASGVAGSVPWLQAAGVAIAAGSLACMASRTRLEWLKYRDGQAAPRPSIEQIEDAGKPLSFADWATLLRDRPLGPAIRFSHEGATPPAGVLAPTGEVYHRDDSAPRPMPPRRPGWLRRAFERVR